jgi:hypothetical protein
MHHLYPRLLRLSALILGGLLGRLLTASEFTVLVYNVENLFDVDGVAVYDDYGDNTWNPERPYTPAQLHTKLRNIVRVLGAVNEGRGPEVILFQEIELDRTPFGSQGTPAELLAPWEGVSVAEMLGAGFDRAVANLPAEVLLWKLLEEEGMGGYFVAKPDPWRGASVSAVVNVIFSRFPIRATWQRPKEQARDLLVAELDVHGHPFIVLNNHWKSGASNRATAAVRRQNALVVRAELEALLLRNPSADILIAGDLNSHYNQRAVFPEWGPVGVNDILGSQSDEARLIADDSVLLYNLWGELPLEERGSEVFRGRWGTLMQMLVTRGLYDDAGIRYVDDSFFRLILPGVNVEPIWGAPVRWAALGDGGGFSDHLPIGARFTVGETGDTKRFPTFAEREPELPAHQPVVDYAALPPGRYPEARMLADLDPAEQLQFLGRIFDVRGTVSADGRAILIGDASFGFHAPDRALRERWQSLQPGETVRFHGAFGVFRGVAQFVVEDPSWWR